MAEYDSIATDYKKSKFAPWRIAVEAHSLFQLLGDIRGCSVLDLACGDGIYSRRLRLVGASQVVGMDLSDAMIALAREEEQSHPLGIEYHVGDAQRLDLGCTFDIVFAAYLLNYARNLEELAAFASVVSRHLKPGGRFIGINNNPSQDPSLFSVSRPFGFIKCMTEGIPLQQGSSITYKFFQDGNVFQFDNYHLPADDHATVMAENGLHGFQWHPLSIDRSLIPAEQSDLDWDALLASAPVLCFSASKSLG